MTKIVFAKLLPTSVAFMHGNAIYIDEKFRESAALEHILQHERQHRGKLREHDIITELTNLPETKNMIEILRKKPFFAISFLVPFHKFGRIWFIDLFRLPFCIIFLGMFLLTLVL